MWFFPCTLLFISKNRNIFVVVFNIATSFKQILNKKMDNLEKKVIGSVANEPSAKVRVLLGSISDLQKQLNDFCRVVEDYKQNLYLVEHLQQMMEEVLVNLRSPTVPVIMMQEWDR